MKPNPNQPYLMGVDFAAAPDRASKQVVHLTGIMTPEEYTRRVAALPKLKALSIRQPWAWLITRPDIVGYEARWEAYNSGVIKTFENREWSEKNAGRKFKGEFLLHAAQGCTKAEYGDACAFARHCGVKDVPPLEKLERGGIVGKATVLRFVVGYDEDDENEESHWRVGDGLLLRNIEALPFVPCKGSLGFFNPVFPEVAAS